MQDIVSSGEWSCHITILNDRFLLNDDEVVHIYQLNIIHKFIIQIIISVSLGMNIFQCVMLHLTLAIFESIKYVIVYVVDFVGRTHVTHCTKNIS